MTKKKTVEVTKEEIVEWVRVYPLGSMKVAFVHRVMEGDQILSENKQARLILPGDSQTGQPAIVKKLMAAMHTDACVKAHKKLNPAG